MTRIVPLSYSVVMPVYNGRKYFQSAIQSAVNAISDTDEIIVIEDGSTDGGVKEIVAKFNTNSNIKYFTKENGGVATALNEGLDAAEKKYFSWLSHDDIYLPNRFARDRELRSWSSEIVTLTDFYLYYEESSSMKFVDSVKNLERNQRFRTLSRRFLNGNCLTAPVDALKSIGGFKSNLRHAQDYDLWLRLMRQSDIVAIPEPTVLSRQHPAQDSRVEPHQAKIEYRSLLRRNLRVKDFIDPRNLKDWLRIGRSVL